MGVTQIAANTETVIVLVNERNMYTTVMCTPNTNVHCFVTPCVMKLTGEHCCLPEG